MTAYIALKRQCSRCPRIEEETVSLEAAARLCQLDLKGPSAMRVIIDGAETVDFEHLCDPCREITDRALGNIGRALQHKSSTRDIGGCDEPDPGEPVSEPAADDEILVEL